MQHNVFYQKLQNVAPNIFVERPDIVAQKLKDNYTSVFFIDGIDKPSLILFTTRESVNSNLLGRLIWLDDKLSSQFLYTDYSQSESYNEINPNMFLNFLETIVGRIMQEKEKLNPQVEVESLVKYVFQISASTSPKVLASLNLDTITDLWVNDIIFSEAAQLLDSKLYNRSTGKLVFTGSEYKQYVGQPLEWVEKIFTP